MISAARAALGIYVKSGVKKSRASITIRLEMTLDTPVFAPAEKFIAVLENEPLTG